MLIYFLYFVAEKAEKLVKHSPVPLSGRDKRQIEDAAFLEGTGCSKDIIFSLGGAVFDKDLSFLTFSEFKTHNIRVGVIFNTPMRNTTENMGVMHIKKQI